ncbi:MAG: hypothetical protein RLZZ244_403 [Verrucomicrobiota bacterium]|jgi:signal transduction histidine kinase
MQLLLVDPTPAPGLVVSLQEHFTLTSCADPSSALILAAKLQPDWVLSEVILPEGDGFTLCRTLRTLPGLKRTRVVLISDILFSPEDQLQAQRVGASRLFSRHLDPELIAKSLASSLPSDPPEAQPEGTPAEWAYLRETNRRIVREHRTLHARLQALRTQIQDYQENQRQLEQRLRHAQRLGSIGILSSGAAHDFNNILCGIIGLSEIGLRSPSADAEAQRNFEDIRTASHRASHLVRSLLSFSRKQEQPRGPICPALALAEALLMLRATIPSYIELAEDIQAPDSHILGEISQFQQIITNLILNAWHAIGNKSGRILLQIRLAPPSDSHLHRLPQLQKKPYLCLRVSDTGSGITPENLDRIFEPFFTTKPSDQGSGLGLWVSRGIVDSWDGSMTVDSAPGSGTTFTLYFPEVSSHSSDSYAPNPSIPTGQGQKILFVDEEELLGSLVTQCLSSFGYQPTIAHNAEEAVQQVISQQFDAVLTDLTMPGLSGIELAQALWKLNPHLPILLTTGHTDKMDEATAQSLGFKKLLPKPFDSRTLIQTLHNVLHLPSP